MLKSLFVLLTSIFILNFNLNAQWEHANGGKQLPDSTGISAVIANGSTIITATSKGVYVSTNNGDNWIQKNSGLANPKDIISLAVKENFIFAGTSDAIYMSSDNGNNWVTKDNGMNPEMVNSFVINGNTIIAGTTGGIYVSSDNGNNWALSNQGISDYSGIYALYLKGSTIYAGTDNGVYASTNNGASWSNKNFTDAVSRLIINKNNIYISGEGYHSGIYVSTDNGGNWTAKNQGLDTSHDAHYSFVSVGDTVFAGGTNSGAYLTTDNGNTWLPANYGLSAYVQQNELMFTLNDNYVFVGSTGSTGFCNLWRLPRHITGVNDFNVNQDEIVKVYPNPTNNQINVTIDLPNDGNVSVSVYDNLGNKIYSMPTEMKFVGTNKFTISTADFPEGIYYLSLRTAQSIILKKFAVIK